MVARANIALDDGESSPVTHTFTPDGETPTNSNEASYVNRNTSVPAASERLLIEVKASSALPEDFSTPGKKVSPRSVKVRVKYPATYTDAVSGLTLVDFVDEAIIDYKIHPRSSEQRAKNLMFMVKDLHAEANGSQFYEAVTLGERIW